METAWSNPTADIADIFYLDATKSSPFRNPSLSIACKFSVPYMRIQQATVALFYNCRNEGRVFWILQSVIY